MIIETYKYPISLYGICLFASLVIGFTIATVIMVRQKVNSVAVICSFVLNIPLLLSFGFIFNIIVNIGKENIKPGITSIGCAFGICTGAITVALIFKSAKLLQAYFTVLPLIYSIAKTGCFLGGCCGGLEYHGPLAVNYLRHNEYAYPTLTFPIQLLETAVFMIIFIILVVLYKKIKWQNHIALNGILCGAAKFILDFFRHSHIDVKISIIQILCIPVVIASVIFIFAGKKIGATQITHTS